MNEIEYPHIVFHTLDNVLIEVDQFSCLKGIQYKCSIQKDRTCVAKENRVYSLFLLKESKHSTPPDMAEYTVTRNNNHISKFIMKLFTHRVRIVRKLKSPQNRKYETLMPIISIV